MFQHILALVIKELLAVLRDPRSRFVLIGPPIAQLMIFGFAATFDLNHAALAIYDQDCGAAARELIARFEGSRNFDIVARLDHDGQIAPLIDGRAAPRLDGDRPRPVLPARGRSARVPARDGPRREPAR